MDIKLLNASNLKKTKRGEIARVTTLIASLTSNQCYLRAILFCDEKQDKSVVPSSLLIILFQATIAKITKSENQFTEHYDLFIILVLSLSVISLKMEITIYSG